MGKDKEIIDDLAAKARVESPELTEAEKLELEKEAQAEVVKELKAEKRREFKAAAKARLKKQVLFSVGKDEEGDDTEVVLIQLAAQGAEILLDDKRFIHGRAYRMKQATAQAVKDIMFRGDRHDAEIHGKKMSEFYGTRPRNLTISPNKPMPVDARIH